MNGPEYPPTPNEVKMLRDELRRIREVQSIGLMSEVEALSVCDEVIISTVQNRLLSLLIRYQEYALRCYNKQEISLRISDVLNGAPILHVSELNILRDRLLGGRNISLRSFEAVLGDVPMDKFHGLELVVTETGSVKLFKIR